MNNLIKKGSLIKIGCTLFLVLDISDEKYKLYFFVTPEAFTIHNVEVPSLDWRYLISPKEAIDSHLGSDCCSILVY